MSSKSILVAIIAILALLCGVSMFFEKQKEKEQAEFMRVCLQNPFRTVEECRAALSLEKK